MKCTVCGQFGACKCLAVDELGNPVGEWVHPLCIRDAGVVKERQTLSLPAPRWGRARPKGSLK